MIQKLVTDRFLTLPPFDQSPPPADPTFPPHFVPALGRTYNIEESEGSGFLNRTRTSQVSAGGHATKTHRTFRWMPWVKGKVACVPLAGSDILTGTMTGCWLVIFTRNGVRYAGHIGTFNDANTPESIQAKAAWRGAVNAGLITPVAAVNPVGPTLPPFSAMNLKNGVASIYGGLTPSGTIYTIVFSLTGVGGTGPARIAHVAQVPTTQDVTAF